MNSGPRHLAFGGGYDLEDRAGGAAFLLRRRGAASRGQHGPAGKRHGAQRAAPHLIVGGQALFEKQEIRIHLGRAGEREEPDLHPRLERHRQEPQGGLLAGPVAVEEAFHLGMVAAQEGELAAP